LRQSGRGRQNWLEGAGQEASGDGDAAIALSKPDKISRRLNSQPEHIEIAGVLGLGEFDDARIDLLNIELT
jgi:hypothetical protein